MKRLIREPLVHFFLLGAGLFVVHEFVAAPSMPHPQEIVVTRARVEQLATGFARAWQRPPSDEELAGLIQDYVREEICCREAKSLGLDLDDTIIRRRLRQKMEFITEDLTALSEPTDAQLESYLNQHPDDFRIPPRFSFRQVFLDPQRRADNLAGDVNRLLDQLNQSPEDDASEIGDSFLLGHAFESLTPGEIALQFGPAFAETLALGELTLGRWHGPLPSSYGAHLVFISQRTEGRLPALPDVHDAVLREWSSDKRLEANEKFYQALLERYAVTIETPRSPPTGQALAEPPP